MKRPLLPRLAAAVLILALLVSSASALTLEDARELLERNYVDPVPAHVLEQPSIQAMVAALGDPYTEYLTPQQYQRFQATMEDDSLVGIGVSIPVSGDTADGLLLTEILPGGPAEKAGLQEGDRIVAVDHKSVTGMEANAAIALIRGEEGTQVAITYLRDGRRSLVVLTRERVYIPATDGSLLPGGVGYIQCTTWGSETTGHFRRIMEELDGQVGCWLIDLRDNGGGLTNAACATASLFCQGTDMLYLRLRDDTGQAPDGYTYQIYPATQSPITDKPVVLLVNEGSASSSEIFSSILRDYGRAAVVGSRTYGKGVALGVWDQSNTPRLFPDGDAFKITIARAFSPLGNTCDSLGVMPDLLVEGDEESAETALALAQAFAEKPSAWQDFTLELQEQAIDDGAFADTAGHPYGRSAAALHVFGLVNGKGDGLFHPEDSLTRAELAQIMANTLNSRLVENTGAFADVPGQAWYSPAVTAIAAQGLMTGTGQSRFSPEATLTHQELFTVVGRLARWLNDDLDLSVRRSDGTQEKLKALGRYAPWAKSPVWLLSCALENEAGGTLNLLWDYPEDIDPTAPATRGETAEVLYNLLAYLSILP